MAPKTSMKSETPHNDWVRFLAPGDAFLISYAALPPMPEVTLFLVGHAVELYLKAVLTKQSGDIDKAVSLGHSVKGLLVECQMNDPSFMPKINYRSLETDQEYRAHHGELYTIIKNLPDLKYIGATKRQGGFSFGFLYPNSYWVDLFKEIRLYLGWPIKGHLDYLKYCFDNLELPVQAREYLKGIFE